MAQYTIPAVNLAALEDRFAKLNKRAVKLNVAPVSLTITGWIENISIHDITGIETVEKLAVVEVNGESPKLSGWTFQAKIEPHDGFNLVKLMPGIESVPAGYFDAKMTCQHCNTNRQRNEVFVVRHDDGRYMQVGRNCLADFLGGANPETLANRAEWYIQLDEEMREASDRGYGGSRGFFTENTEAFVAMCAAVAREDGFVTRRMIDEGKSNGPTTGSQAWIYCTDVKAWSEATKDGFAVTEADVLRARFALDWARNEAVPDGNYMTNLVNACRAEAIDYRAVGIVASVIPAYRRHMESLVDVADDQAPAPAPKPISQYVGVVGQKVSVKVTVEALIDMPQNAWGTYSTLVKMVDEQGNKLAWFASNCPDIEPGDTVTATGTVKSHQDYRGERQTTLTRCKLIG